MASQLEQLFSGRDLPNPNRPVFPRRQQPLSVGAKGDAEHAVGMPLKAGEDRSRFKSPDEEIAAAIELNQAGARYREKLAIGTVGDPARRLTRTVIGCNLDMAGAAKIVPFPVAQVGRALLQQALGASDIVGQHLAIRQARAMKVEVE